MLEMTEASIHHARFCVMKMTNADPIETEQELATARRFAFAAGKADFHSNQVKAPHLFPSTLYKAYEDGHIEAWMEDSLLCEIAEELAFYRVNYPDSSVERFLYCPSGHNVVLTKAGCDECAACGKIMTEGAKDHYYESLISAGQCM